MTNNISLHMLAKMIDHSLLHPTMTDQVIAEGCAQARQYNVATVCVKPYAVVLARDLLAGSNVEVCSVIGFPHGNSICAMKVAELNKPSPTVLLRLIWLLISARP